MRKLLCLVPALLLAGCHSQQVAFQFQPAPATSVPVASAPASPEITIVAAAPTPATAAPGAKLLAKPTQRLRPRRLASALKALPQSALVTLATPAKASQQLASHLGRRPATEGAAENGLGRVALFFIGVVLAVVAGLAALLALIPGVSFWGGLGLAVAALVVVFLLYSLVSGGKKKKA
ncbi:MAG: hypothetical protein ACRYF0_09775 [Janthinobacterium lividum]